MTDIYAGDFSPAYPHPTFPGATSGSSLVVCCCLDHRGSWDRHIWLDYSSWFCLYAHFTQSVCAHLGLPSYTSFSIPWLSLLSAAVLPHTPTAPHPTSLPTLPRHAAAATLFLPLFHLLPHTYCCLPYGSISFHPFGFFYFHKSGKEGHMVFGEWVGGLCV